MKFIRQIMYCLVLFLFLSGGISAAGSLIYSYDNQDRLVAVENPGKYRIEYSYNPAGNRISHKIELSAVSFDHEGDGDVDGKDLVAFAASWDGSTDALAQFAAAFGND